MTTLRSGDDLAEVAAAIVAAYQALQRPVESRVERVWKTSGQVAPIWSAGGRRRGWKDVDRERGWQR